MLPGFLTALIGFFFLVKGIFDVTVSEPSPVRREHALKVGAALDPWRTRLADRPTAILAERTSMP